METVLGDIDEDRRERFSQYEEEGDVEHNHRYPPDQ
jgi:hypothetical protein